VSVFQNSHTLNSSDYIRNIITDTTILSLNKNNFDISVRLNYIPGTPAIQNNLDKYVVLLIEQTLMEWVQDEHGSPVLNLTHLSHELIPCPEGRYKNDKQFTDARNITGQYLCPKDQNFLL
jgi:hypothetical protein